MGYNKKLTDPPFLPFFLQKNIQIRHPVLLNGFLQGEEKKGWVMIKLF